MAWSKATASCGLVWKAQALAGCMAREAGFEGEGMDANGVSDDSPVGRIEAAVPTVRRNWRSNDGDFFYEHAIARVSSNTAEPTILELSAEFRR